MTAGCQPVNDDAQQAKLTAVSVVRHRKCGSQEYTLKTDLIMLCYCGIGCGLFICPAQIDDGHQAELTAVLLKGQGWAIVPFRYTLPYSLPC